MRYMGIDPGKSGAYAVLEGGGAVIETGPIPTVKSTRGRDEYDLPEIRELLRRQAMDAGGALRVAVELLHPLPPARPGKFLGGSVANFQRGVSRGWEWMLVGLGISYSMVPPMTWQRVMHAGTAGQDTKQRSIMACKMLWPAWRLRRTDRCRKDDDGIAEALLIAEHLRRTVGAEAA